MIRMITTETGGHLVPPCPSWCVLPDDHDLANETAQDNDGAVWRQHKAAEWSIGAGRNTVRTEVVETVVAGRVDTSPEGPLVLIDAHCVVITAGQARAVAKALMDAADILDGIR